MLKITRTTREGTRLVRLEGNLAGPWVAEARASCESELALHGGLALDLAEVRFVDAEGLRFLRGMEAAGHVRTRSSFVAELLRREGSG